MECQYCKKTFCNTNTLRYHQRNTKACLIIQNKLERVEKKFDCSFCKEFFSSKFNLNRHTPVCPKKIIIEKEKEQCTKKELAELIIKQREAFELEKKELLEKLKQTETELHLERKKERTPTKISNKTHIDTQNITNNNNINIYQVMTPEHVLDVFQKHYSLDTLLGGQKALARFVNEEFLKKQATPVYVCGDRSRQKFYMIKDGKKEEDPDCENIIGLSTPGLPHVRDVYEEALFKTHEEITEDDIQDNYRTIVNIDKERTQFKSEMSKITTNSDAPESTPWEKALKQLRIMRENLLPYENEDKCS